MRIIKLGIISLVVFFLLITFISFLFPSHIRISKAVNIPNKKDSVFYLLIQQEQWVRWHPAYRSSKASTEMALLIKTQLEKTDSTFVLQLQSPGKRAITNGWQVFGQPNADSLTLQWYMDFDLKWYPWQKFGSLFFEPTYGNMMQQGLANLKAILER